MATVKFEIDTDAITYGCYLEDIDTNIIDVIDKDAGGVDQKDLASGSYEARIIFVGTKNTYAKITVSVDGGAKVVRNLKIKNEGQKEGRGGRTFTV